MSNRRFEWKKLLCILLVCIFMTQLVPASVLAEVVNDVQELRKTADTVIATEVEEPATIVGEVETERDESVKHYRLSDGSFVATQYAEPVHYKAADGQWKNIDNTLTLDGEMYTAQAGEVIRQFPKDLSSGELFEIAYGDYSLSMSVVSPDDGAIPSTGGSSISQPLEPTLESEASVANPEDVNVKGLEPDSMPLPARLSSEISYKDAYKDTDIVYKNHGYNIKESIVVNSPQSSYTYAFQMTAKGLSAELTDEGSVELKNEEGTEIFTIPAPYMTDADGASSTEARYVLAETDDGYILGLIASPEWINASGRAFPVVIDPSVYLHYKISDMKTTYLRQNMPDSKSPSYAEILCGRNNTNSYGACKMVVQVESLPSIPKNCVMINAQLAMLLAATTVEPDPFEITISAYSLKRTVSDLKSLTWNGVHGTSGIGYDSTIIDHRKITDDDLQKYVSWDVTSAAKNWYSSTAKKGALIFESLNQYTSHGFAKFIGHDWYENSPYFIVNYRNTVGLEDYYTYQTVSAARGGTVHIGDYSSQLALVNTIASYNTDAISTDVSLVYNTAYASRNFSGSGDGMNVPDLSYMKIGLGWKLSVAQTLKEVSLSGTTYIVYNDADGTEHYFSGSSGTYKDEDGLGLTIVKSSSGYTMTDTDKYHTWTFSNYGLLTKIADSNNNAVNINYSNSHISSITAKSNGGTTVTVATLTYDSNNYLKTIVDNLNRTTEFTYSGGVLSKIKYADGTTVDYSYDSGYLTRIYDNESLYGLTFTYWNGIFGGKRVYKVQEFSGSANKLGNAFHCYKNSEQLTSYRFYGADHEVDADNESDSTADDIVVFYAFDNAGRTICSYETNHNKTKVTGSSAASYTQNSETSGKNNRLTSAGAMGMTYPAVSADGGFEVKSIGKTTGTASIITTTTTDDARVHMGFKSLCITNSGAGYVKASLASGETYTVSCYVKNSSTTWGSGAYGKISVLNSSGTEVEASQQFTTKTSSDIDDGWERISYTFASPGTGTYYIGVSAGGFSGSYYVDDIQIDTGALAGSKNLVNGGKPNSTEYWGLSQLTYDSSSQSGSPFGAGVFKISGDISTNKIGAVNVNINEKSGGTYIVSGWGKATAVGSTATAYEGEKPYFGMLAAVYYTGVSGEEWHFIPFSKDYTDWQFASGIVVPKQDKPVKMIKVYLIYKNNGGTAYFDNISLTKEPCSSYTYDDKGNPVSAKEGGAKTNCEYQSGTSILTKYTASTGVTSSFTYAPTTHNLNTVTSAGVTTTNTHNSAGLVTQSVSTGGGQKQKTSATYDSYGQKTSSTDVNNTTTSYDRSYYTGHHISGITEGSLKQQRFTYLTNERLSITSMNGLAAQHYNYSTGQLSALARKSRVGTGAFTWQSYHFAYDPFGNMTQISVSGADNTATSAPSSAIMLAKYQYESGVNNGRLQKMTFGNDQTVQYSYDKFDRTTKEQYNNVTYEYAYDASGQLAKQTSTAGEEYNYEYDSLGRLIRSNEYNDGTFEQRTEHIYDASNRLTKQSWYNAGGVTTMSYAYSTTTGLLSSLNATVQNSSIPVTYTYQGTNQLRSKAIGSVMTKAYNYCYNEDGGYRAALPNYVNYRDSSGNLIYGDNCHYDSNGRLVKILDSGSSTTTRATYGYDQQGQLTSATVGGTSYTYTYDTAGNIQSKKVGSTTTNYTYGNSAWRDLLTAYGGNTITYSGGNPTKYYDGSTFTWTQGRRLATAKVGSTNISYTYDMAGVRSSKTVGSTTYKFTTLSGLVTRQTGGNKTIDFVYDENNQPLAMKYNNTLYYYVLNAQGDVVRIVNSSRSVVASYTYDPWGKIISSSGTLADINPLRYRGYYYDSETGFYYLQSRYYDPEIGRFINADSYASTDMVGLLSTNMFSYCENNPVMRVDPTGELFWDILDVFMAALSWDDFLESPSLVNLGWAALDTLALLPGVPSSGYARRGVEVVSSISHANKAKDAAKIGWKVGDDISKLTRAGNVPSWSTVRQRYWKNEALTNFKKYSPENLMRMSHGRAPLVKYEKTGEFYSMELHHPNGREGKNMFCFIKVTPWEHDILDPYRHFRP